MFHPPEPTTWLPVVEGTAGPALAGGLREGRNVMHPEDLMKPDLFSEIVLTGSGGLLLASLLLIIAIALARV